ncbi:hypothetical protein A3K86_16810 [Photobacterium jeanii]|uniref:CENP-V/GFA domain-containing protein n=1 Tax=Photobacterium jeanii TaxID=858640 RepID=A0A178K9I5_9GAMM|nr:GFA family protein [Photobacterium jeanii]OAN13313.1 hypothetical protein A3K86_16810 [Photobacterium jeanii]PST90312.1 GFA family protein [Photobacterium jeanii]
MENVVHTAKCLCGKVELKVKPKSNKFVVCHCDTCKRWNGGPQFAMPCGTDITMKGQDHLSVFSSSPWATRGFCKRCGTHLYYRLNHSGEYNILLGALDIDKDENLEIEVQYFIDRKPAYYSLDADSPVLTTKEMLELFGA